jgi:tRNA-dihydrouridine synthase C
MQDAMLLALAPMKDMTNLAFLRILSALGTLPDYFITEYFRSNPHLKCPDPFVMRSIDENPTGKPIFGQLVGSDTPSLVRDALDIMKHPVAGVDLNMGCPAQLVCKKFAGGGMLQKLRSMDSTLGQLRDALPAGSFSVKCRLGWESPDEFAEIIRIIKKHAPDRLAIHGRTVKEGYRSPVHPEWVAYAVQELPCPVMANGNVVGIDTADAWVHLAQPGGLMIGRGAIRNPWIFDQLRAHFNGQKPPSVSGHMLLEYIGLLDQEMARLIVNYDEKKHVNCLKKFLIYIACGFPDDFGKGIRRASNLADFHAICRAHLDHNDPVLVSPPSDASLFAYTTELADLGRLSPNPVQEV